MPESREAVTSRPDEKYMTRPIPGRHLVDDEFIDPKKCKNKAEHSDHYWHTDPSVPEPWDIRDNRVFYCLGTDDD